MNQADQIEIVRHRRKLATNSLSREKESVVEHGHHSAMDHRYRIMDSQRTVSSVLTDCLIQGAHLREFLPGVQLVGTYARRVKLVEERQVQAEACDPAGSGIFVYTTECVGAAE